MLSLKKKSSLVFCKPFPVKSISWSQSVLMFITWCFSSVSGINYLHWWLITYNTNIYQTILHFLVNSSHRIVSRTWGPLSCLIGSGTREMGDPLFVQNETAGRSSIRGWGGFLICLKNIVIISLLAISIWPKRNQEV